MVDEQTDLSRRANDDVNVPVTRRKREKITRIVNIYDQSDTQSGERQGQKVNRQRVIWQGGTILGGDINAHSSRMNPRCPVQRNGAFWDGVTDENGLEIGHDRRSTNYWTREDNEGEPVICLTLANRPIMRKSRLTADHATGSDHKDIEWEVEVVRQEEVDHARVVRWNLTAMLEKDVEVLEELWMKVAKERAHLGTECTEDKVEQEAAWCLEAMSSILNTTAKKSRICAQSTKWWNANIKERSQAVRREKR